MTPEKPQRTAQISDKYIVRFPDGMRDLIAAAAKASGRSMNAEIVARLEKSFNPIGDEGDVLQAVRAISEYSARFGTSVSVQFSKSRESILLEAIKNGTLPPDATLEDVDNPGPAIARHAAQRAAENAHQSAIGNGEPVPAPLPRKR